MSESRDAADGGADADAEEEADAADVDADADAEEEAAAADVDADADAGEGAAAADVDADTDAEEEADADDVDAAAANTTDGDAGGPEPYVHRPAGEPAPDSGSPPDSGSAAGDGSGLGRRGQVLVAAVLLATLVVPGVISLYPELLADRVPFLVAMLVLPFVPALLLGVAAVWAMAGRR